jgi:gas vesicle protein
MENNDSSKFVYFLTGVSIGAVLGILFAPQSGAETREMIADRASESREYLLRKSRELREQADGLLDRGREMVTDQRDHLMAAVEAGKAAYRSESQTRS